MWFVLGSPRIEEPNGRRFRSMQFCDECARFELLLIIDLHCIELSRVNRAMHSPEHIGKPLPESFCVPFRHPEMHVHAYVDAKSSLSVTRFHASLSPATWIDCCGVT